MSSPKSRVAICGGGIGGLTLAVALGKYSDIPIDVYRLNARSRFVSKKMNRQLWFIVQTIQRLEQIYSSLCLLTELFLSTHAPRRHAARPSPEDLSAYPISNGSMINFLAFYTVPDGEGTPFPGKWVEDAPKEEALAHYVDWERMCKRFSRSALEPMVSRWAVHVMGSVPFAGHGRVAILGDAMHAMTPHVSAGAGQAMEDACMLGRLLAHDLTTRDTVPAAMHIYEDRRLAFANAVVTAARETGLMYKFNGPEYDGALPMDADALRRWRESIFRRWEFQWQGSPLEECSEAEEMLRHAVLEN